MIESDILLLQDSAFKTSFPEWLHSVPKCEGHIYYKFLSLLSGFLSPRLSVELGTLSGAGAWSIWNGYKDGRVVSIDVDPRFISDFCYASGIEYRCHDSLEVDGDLMNIGFLFIDTVHNGDRPFQEYTKWKSNLSTNAVVAFDDIWINPKMKSMWDKLDGRKMELYVHDQFGFGLLY